MIFEKQQYQQDCVNNIITVLDGVDFDNLDFSGLSAQLKNLSAQHQRNHSINNKPRLDVLMETGTGKTFTYLQTIFELNKQFGQNKFIIVLPRTAIKLGVIQQIKLSKEYFYNQYQKHLNYIDYPLNGLASIQQNFINANDLSIIITTNSAFNSDKNTINQKTENLFKFGSTWNGINAQKPIVIIDEPHLLKGGETTKWLEQLTNAFFIRFGATYPSQEKHKLSNVVYTLDSISSFNQYLVKRIGVSTLFSEDEQSNILAHNIKAGKFFDAHYHINNQLYKTKIDLKDDIGAKTGLNHYQGISVVKINKYAIFLSNQTKLEPVKKYSLADNEIKQMLRQTIQLHFAKEEALFTQGIKALSLFFIPQVADFRGDNPRIKQYFAQEYKIIRDEFYQNTNNKQYKAYLDKDYQNGQLKVHEGYFSGDKLTKKEKDSKMNKDDVGINIILNEKEKLLSFATPLRFIFSVWALQEGWDNPNIFTLCKLSSTKQDTSRRQQVGRGLRIAVNQQGKRLTYTHLGEKESNFYAINTLDMVVSGHEQDFIQHIQQEIIEASFAIAGDTITLDILKGKKLTDIEATAIFMGLVSAKIINQEGIIQSPILDFLSAHRQDFALISDERFAEIKQLFTNNHQNIVDDKNKQPQLVKIRQQHWKNFKTLWETINKKSKIVYQPIKQNKLIKDISQAFNETTISPIKIKIKKQSYNAQENLIKTDYEEIIGDKNYFKRQNLSQFISKFASDENLPFAFICQLFNQLKLTQFYNNPKSAQDLLKKIIKDNIHQSLIQSVDYQFSQTSIYANELQDENGELIAEIKRTLLGKYVDKDNPPIDEFLYDSTIYDSSIEKASIIKHESEKITVFAKLPKINIPTPHKTYNPDFAYLIKKSNGKQLFLVVETKGYKYESDISATEKQKINYGKKFFDALQRELPKIEIKYRTRINGQDLSELLEDMR